MKNSKKSGIIAFIVILLLIVLIGTGNLLTWIFKPFSNRAEVPSGLYMENSGWGYIAKIKIEGIIQESGKTYNQEWLLNTISMLKNDDENVAMTIFINSPGGNVYQSDEVYLALKDYENAGKPVYVYQGPLAASGAYYISSAATKIYANRNTLTGSIGVICGESLDATELLSKIGIKSTTITSGKNKNMMNFNQPFTDEQKEIMQSISDECYDQFTEIVSAERNLPLETVKKLADGRIYTAKQAKNNGLIDEIDTFNNMVVSMEKDYLGNMNFRIKDFSYEAPGSLMDNLIFGESAESRISSVISKVFDKSGLNFPAYLYE